MPVKLKLFSLTLAFLWTVAAFAQGPGPGTAANEDEVISANKKYPTWQTEAECKTEFENSSHDWGFTQPMEVTCNRQNRSEKLCSWSGYTAKLTRNEGAAQTFAAVEEKCLTKVIDNPADASAEKRIEACIKPGMERIYALDQLFEKEMRAKAEAECKKKRPGESPEMSFICMVELMDGLIAASSDSPFLKESQVVVGELAAKCLK